MEKENTFFKDYQDLINSFEALKKEANNPFFKSKYVPLKVILPVVKKHCTDHGFILMQYPIGNRLHTKIVHKQGDSVHGEMDIVAKDPTDPQKVGGGLTYARRYSLTCMFGLEEEDDDGNNASKPAPQNNAYKPHTATEKVTMTDALFNSMCVPHFKENDTVDGLFTRLSLRYTIDETYKKKIKEQLELLKLK